MNRKEVEVRLSIETSPRDPCTSKIDLSKNVLGFVRSSPVFPTHPYNFVEAGNFFLLMKFKLEVMASRQVGWLVEVCNKVADSNTQTSYRSIWTTGSWD